MRAADLAAQELPERRIEFGAAAKETIRKNYSNQHFADNMALLTRP
jgi:hypothetical protein